jgi:hypothetical protein
VNGQSVILTGAASRAAAKRIIDAAPMNAVCNVHLPKRSKDQNALLWALLSDVSRSKPEGRMHTPDVWKDLFMAACGHAAMFETGLDGKPFPLGFRSSKMDKDQMKDLLDFIQAWGSERGVQWTTKEGIEA